MLQWRLKTDEGAVYTLDLVGRDHPFGAHLRSSWRLDALSDHHSLLALRWCLDAGASDATCTR